MSEMKNEVAALMSALLGPTDDLNEKEAEALFSVLTDPQVWDRVRGALAEYRDPANGCDDEADLAFLLADALVVEDGDARQLTPLFYRGDRIYHFGRALLASPLFAA